VETSDTCMRYEGFTGVKIQIVDLPVLTLCSLVGSYQSAPLYSTEALYRLYGP